MLTSLLYGLTRTPVAAFIYSLGLIVGIAVLHIREQG